MAKGSAVSYAHEAGFDAFMTGTVFANLVAQASQHRQGTHNDGWLPSEVEKFKGKISMHRSAYPHMNLWGAEDVPESTDVFVLSNVAAWSRSK
eukprot:scaffold369146_cov41-Prasinocladus_malaysianus.AAC.1